MPLQEGYGQLYTQENVVISGIHTHSGPAGYLQYLLYDIPARGFVHETFNVLVNGIAAVRLPLVHIAHESFASLLEGASRVVARSLCLCSKIKCHNVEGLAMLRNNVDVSRHPIRKFSA